MSWSNQATFFISIWPTRSHKQLVRRFHMTCIHLPRNHGMLPSATGAELPSKYHERIRQFPVTFRTCKSMQVQPRECRAISWAEISICWQFLHSEVHGDSSTIFHHPRPASLTREQYSATSDWDSPPFTCFPALSGSCVRISFHIKRLEELGMDYLQTFAANVSARLLKSFEFLAFLDNQTALTNCSGKGSIS